MKKKSYLIVALAVVLILAGTYAYTYTSAGVTGEAVTARDIATCDEAPTGDQPDWDSIIPDTHIETLRPDAAGDKTELVQEPDSGAHWEKVDEAGADGDSTYVATDVAKWEKDLYNIPDHSVSGTVDHVKVYICCRAVDTPTQASARVLIKTEGKEKEGSEETVTTSYALYSYQWDTNPQTGEAWTWAQIDALQIGVKLKRAADGIFTRCTQVYAKVGYTLPICGDVPEGDLFEVTVGDYYNGDMQVAVYLTNTGALIKAYQYLNMKLRLEGSEEWPDYRLLTLNNGVATFRLQDCAGDSYTLSVIGGSYCLVSTDSSEWSLGWSGTPEFYCEVLQK